MGAAGKHPVSTVAHACTFPPFPQGELPLKSRTPCGNQGVLIFLSTLHSTMPESPQITTILRKLGWLVTLCSAAPADADITEWKTSPSS